MRRTAVVLAATLALAGTTSAAAPPGRIVYSALVGTTDQQSLYVERPDGSGASRITHGTLSYAQPQWSPNGRQIVARAGRGLVILTADGHIVRRIRTHGGDEARWSPDGTRIAYLNLRCYDSRGQTPLCADLFVVRADGTGGTRIVGHGAVDASQGELSLYSWSPDGRTIVYVGRNGLEAVDVAAGRKRLLVRAPKLIVQYPTWSPDGRSILFAKQRAPGRSTDLAVVAPDGSGLHVLPGTRDALEPRWSPDGRRIAFLSNDTAPSATSWPVIVTNADGTARRRVARSSDYQVLEWSPDSSRVLFAGTRDSFEIASADGRGTPIRIRGGDDPDWR